jgi:hypothetical protein
MKVDAQSSDDREKEALEWAIGYFRNCAAELAREGSSRFGEETALGLLITGNDASNKKRATRPSWLMS